MKAITFLGTPGFHLRPNIQVLVPSFKRWGSCLHSLPHLPGVAGQVPSPALPFLHTSMAGKDFLASPWYLLCARDGAAAVLLMFPGKVSGSPPSTSAGLGSLVW